MPVYALFAGREHLKRPDGANFAIVNAANPGAARTRLGQLLGEDAAAFADWDVRDLATATQPVVVQGLPVGAVGQTSWPTLGRGGSPLRGA